MRLHPEVNFPANFGQALCFQHCCPSQPRTTANEADQLLRNRKWKLLSWLPWLCSSLSVCWKTFQLMCSTQGLPLGSEASHGLFLCRSLQPTPSLAHGCARVPGGLQVMGTSWEQPGDSSELSHVLCCAPWALYPRSGTVGRDLSQQLRFFSCSCTGWDWNRF